MSILKPPTLSELCATLRFEHRVDRGSMVMEPKPDRKPGVAVLMLSQLAIRELGPVVEDFARPITAKQNPKTRIVIPPEAPITEYLFEVERVGLWFTWLKNPDLDCLVAFFVGSPAHGGVVDGRLCMELTRRGCPTSLD